jgi:hypothetical protein
VADDGEAEEEPAMPVGGTGFKEAFLGEVRRSKVGFYQMTVAQAHRIEVQGDRVVFEFTPTHKLMRDQLEQNRAWLEPLAARIAGRRMQVVSALVEAPAPQGGGGAQGGGPDEAAALKAEAAADPDVKMLLDLLPAEIRDVEKM